MKIAMVLSLLAIGYLIYWNWRRVKERYKPIASRAAEHARIEELMQSFGESRKRLEEVRTVYAARFGKDADLDPAWSPVTRFIELAVSSLMNFKFDLAAHFMEQASNFATNVVNHKALERALSPAADSQSQSGDFGARIAGDGADGIEETRQQVQNALNRRD
jgi:hypothetical protein